MLGIRRARSAPPWLPPPLLGLLGKLDVSGEKAATGKCSRSPLSPTSPLQAVLTRRLSCCCFGAVLAGNPPGAGGRGGCRHGGSGRAGGGLAARSRRWLELLSLLAQVRQSISVLHLDKTSFRGRCKHAVAKLELLCRTSASHGEPALLAPWASRSPSKQLSVVALCITLQCTVGSCCLTLLTPRQQGYPAAALLNFQSPSWNILVLEMGELPPNLSCIRPSSPTICFPPSAPSGELLPGLGRTPMHRASSWEGCALQEVLHEYAVCSKPNPTAFIQVRVSPPVCRQMAAVSCASIDRWWSSSKRTAWKSPTKAKIAEVADRKHRQIAAVEPEEAARCAASRSHPAAGARQEGSSTSLHPAVHRSVQHEQTAACEHQLGPGGSSQLSAFCCCPPGHVAAQAACPAPPRFWGLPMDSAR